MEEGEADHPTRRRTPERPRRRRTPAGRARLSVGDLRGGDLRRRSGRRSARAPRDHPSSDAPRDEWHSNRPPSAPSADPSASQIRRRRRPDGSGAGRRPRAVEGGGGSPQSTLQAVGASSVRTEDELGYASVRGTSGASGGVVVAGGPSDDREARTRRGTREGSRRRTSTPSTSPIGWCACPPCDGTRWCRSSICSATRSRAGSPCPRRDCWGSSRRSRRFRGAPVPGGPTSRTTSRRRYRARCGDACCREDTVGAAPSVDVGVGRLSIDYAYRTSLDGWLGRRTERRVGAIGNTRGCVSRGRARRTGARVLPRGRSPARAVGVLHVGIDALRADEGVVETFFHRHPAEGYRQEAGDAEVPDGGLHERLEPSFRPRLRPYHRVALGMMVRHAPIAPGDMYGDLLRGRRGACGGGRGHGRRGGARGG